MRKPPSSTAKRRSAYSTLAAATAVAGGNANAAEVVFDIPDITASGILFGLVAGTASSSDMNPRDGVVGAGDGKFFLKASSIHQDPAVAEGGFASVLSYGTYGVANPQAASVSIDQAFGFSNWWGDSPRPAKGVYLSCGIEGKGIGSGETGFVGIKFAINDRVHDGWAEITRNGPGSVALHQFVYNDTPGTASALPVAPADDEVEITAFSSSEGVVTIAKKGKANTDYICKQSLILSRFTEIPGSTTTTDGSGKAVITVSASGPKRFCLVEEVPPGL